MDYTTRTRQDWLDFDNARRQAFLPTAQEIELEKQRIEQEKQTLLNEKVTRLGIQRPNPVTKQRALGFLENINAKEFIGEDLELRLDNQKDLFGSFDKAFDELVIKYL